MRRNQLVNSLKSVNDLVKEAKIGEIFESIRGKSTSERTVESALILKSYSNYMSGYNMLSQEERNLIASFDLEGLADASFWTKMLSKDSLDIGTIYAMYTSVESLNSCVEKFLPLLERSSDNVQRAVEGIDSFGNHKKIEMSSLRLLIRENNVPDLTLNNLIDVFNKKRLQYCDKYT